MIRKLWTPEELQEVRDRYAHERTDRIAKDLGRRSGAVYYAANKMGLKKSEEYMASPDACRLRRDNNGGKAFRFKKGQQPHNKGIKRPGWHTGRMTETWFTKGKKPQNWMPIGSTKISDGYVYRKVSDNQLPGMSRFDWKLEHILLWEQHNGPLPPKHRVIFKNRDRSDIRIENLELISIADLMRRNSYHTNYPKEIGLAIQLRGQIVRQINKRKRKRNEEQNAGSS